MTEEPDWLTFLPADIVAWLRSPYQHGRGLPTWACVSAHTVNAMLLARILDRLEKIKP